MCYYKPNKPPCLCNTHYLAYPCHRAQFLPSQNPQNPSPYVKVCGLITVLPEIRPRACFHCEALFAKFVRENRKTQKSAGLVMSKRNSSPISSTKSPANGQTQTQQQQQQQRRRRQRQQSQAQQQQSKTNQEKGVASIIQEQKQANKDQRNDRQTENTERCERQRMHQDTDIDNNCCKEQWPVRESQPSPSVPTVSAANCQDNPQHGSNNVRSESPVRDEVQTALQEQQQPQPQPQPSNPSVSEHCQSMPSDSIPPNLQPRLPSSLSVNASGVKPDGVTDPEANLCLTSSAATMEPHNPLHGNEPNWILTDTSDAAADPRVLQFPLFSEDPNLQFETLEDYIGVPRVDSTDSQLRNSIDHKR